MLQWLHTQPLKSSILKNRNLEQYFFFTFDNSCCCWYSYILQTAISKKMTLAYFMFLTWLWKKFVCLYSDAFLYLFFMKIIKKYGGLNMSYFAKKGLAANQSCNFFIFLRLCSLAVSYQIDFWIIFFCEDTTVNMNYVSFQSLMKSYSILLLQAILIFQSLKGDLSNDY